MKKTLFFSTLLVLFLSLAILTATSRIDCCSHHCGVCGCGCCDGSSLSAVCAPYYPECSSNSTTTTTNNQTVSPTQAVIQSTPRPTATPTPSPTPTVTPQPTKTPKPTVKVVPISIPTP